MSVFSSITMKHTDGALNTSYYFNLGHIFLLTLVSYVWAQPWDLCNQRSLLSPDCLAPVKWGFVAAHPIGSG